MQKYLAMIEALKSQISALEVQTKSFNKEPNASQKAVLGFKMIGVMLGVILIATFVVLHIWLKTS